MYIRFAINGFGRIGRLFLRIALTRNNIDLIAINDPFITADYAAYMFKYDSTHSKYAGEVSSEGEYLIAAGHNIALYQERDPANIPWKESNIDIVIDSTGIFKELGATQKHLDAGAKKLGVNEKAYAGEKIVSNGSCTTNCLAPLAKLINASFGIEEGLMTTDLSMTATQLTVDGPSHKDWRGGRSPSHNIIPSSTGAAEAVGKVLPELDGKLTGMSFRVPTVDVFVVDITVKLQRPTTYCEIKKVIKTASENELKGVMGYTEDAVVSSDFLGEIHFSIFDASAGIQLSRKFVKLLSWYDNEFVFSTRVVDFVELNASY